MARVRPLPIALLALISASGCATARPASAPGQLGRGSAAIACPARREQDRAQLLRCWGEPSRVERQTSTAPGLGYERWVYGTGAGGPVREAWLADGRVVDVTVSDSRPCSRDPGARSTPARELLPPRPASAKVAPCHSERRSPSSGRETWPRRW